MRINAIIVSLGHALRLCTVPTGQTVYYGHLRESIFGKPFNEIAWIVIAGALIAFLSAEIGRKRLIFGTGIFLLTFLPVSNVIPTGVLVAERTLYLPFLGVCFLMAALLDHYQSGVIGPKVFPRWTFVAILIVYTAETRMVVNY